MENNFWTIGKVIKGKFLFVAIWTYLLSAGMISGADALITYILNKDSGYIFIENYTFLPYSLILIVPAFALAVFIMLTYCKIRTANKDLNDPRVVRQLEHEASFKWSAVYSFLIGYVLLFLWIQVCMAMQQHLIGVAGLLIVPFLIMKPLNKWMVKKTRTNATLIEDLARGVYGDIPEKYMTDEILIGIVETLESGMASSLWSAILVFKCKNIIKGIAKFALGAGVVGAVLVAILTMGAMNSVSSEINSVFKGEVNHMRREREKQELAREIVGIFEANGCKVKRVHIN